MNLEFTYLLDGNFDPSSRVWIYQSSRLFSIGEALQIEGLLKDFTSNWKSHGTPVKGTGYLFFGQFIVLMADETATGVSGCSTDSSVHFVKDLEKQFSVSLFDRTMLAFVVKDKVEQIPLSQLAPAIKGGFINRQTLFFNNTVLTKAELEKSWIVEAGQSWLAPRFAKAETAAAN